jgi:putative endonuclease
MINMHHVYFLQSLSNDKIYCGSTDKDPKTRLMEHNQKSNEWTANNGPFVLIYFESYCCKQDAINREKFYKSGFGRKIRNAILQAISAKGGLIMSDVG